MPRLTASYTKLVDMHYIDMLVDIFESECGLGVCEEATIANDDEQKEQQDREQEHMPLFIKFEFMAMQSLTVILGDAEFSQFWSDKAK